MPFRAFNDMVSRLGMLLTEGESRPQLLVLHPQSSAWICFDNDRSSGLDELDEQLNQLLVHLEDHQIPYHLGDERIVLRHGRVESAPRMVSNISVTLSMRYLSFQYMPSEILFLLKNVPRALKCGAWS